MATNSSNDEIVLGVTGSIAAYKACEIASRLVEKGFRITPVLTDSALELIGAASFEAITGQRAITRMFGPLPAPEIEHIAVAQRAALFLIAPATANILAKAAHGIADDWLSTTLLATRAPILFAPAMNTNMYRHPATQANIQALRDRGCHFMGPGEGRLACGSYGEGRLIDAPLIVEKTLLILGGPKDLAGKRVLITSGGTREPIDPVRYIGNRSSGKMGRALACEALKRGAHVTAVTGPAEVPLPADAETISVETAAQMQQTIEHIAPHADIIIGAAAVADYRVQDAATQKRKRGQGDVALTLVENPDIIAGVAASRRPGQVIVAFAAETHDLIENALAKLHRKGVDIIVANQIGGDESAFASEQLYASILLNDAPPPAPSLQSKEILAARLFDHIVAIFNP